LGRLKTNYDFSDFVTKHGSSNISILNVALSLKIISTTLEQDIGNRHLWVTFGTENSLKFQKEEAVQIS